MPGSTAKTQQLAQLFEMLERDYAIWKRDVCLNYEDRIRTPLPCVSELYYSQSQRPLASISLVLIDEDHPSR